jgi:hypothetical protein
MRESISATFAAILVLSALPAPACTVFSASEGDVVLAGANEDAPFPRGKIWFYPPGKGKYGRVYFGFPEVPRVQAGMNDRGLFWDGLAAETREVRSSGSKPRHPGFLLEKIMEECATVEEALVIFERHSRGFMTDCTYLLADRTGDSAIVEADAVIRKQGRYQVATNFRHSLIEPGEYPCDRYRIAAERLEGADVSVELFRSILASTHVEAPPHPTVYSTICDLRQKVIYVYHYHNFTNVWEIDLAEELKKGRHSYDIPSLFPRTLMAEYFERMYRRGETGFPSPGTGRAGASDDMLPAQIALARTWCLRIGAVAAAAAVALYLLKRRSGARPPGQKQSDAASQQ